MITETPPRTNISSSLAKKRDRTSIQQDTFSFASAPTHNNNNDTGNDLRSFFNKTSPHPSSIAAAAAATVSPFVDRMTFTTSTSNSNSHPNLKLESISEEPSSNGYELSQDSNTSSVTFGSINNNNGLNMDCSSRNSNVMIGTMVGSAVESVVGCSVGGDGEPSSISSGSLTSTNNNSTTGIGGVGFHSLHSECPPPTKRARLDHAYQTIDEDMMGSTASPPNVLTFQSTPSNKQQYQQQQCTEKRMGGNCFNSFGFNNIGRSSNTREVLCCHVCSEEDSANNTSSVTSSPAASFNTTTNETTAAPKSHSLLNFFQSTKKQPSTHPQKLPAANFGNQQQQHNIGASTSHQNDINRSLSSNLSPCRYCDKPTCTSCTRQCEMCQYHFCTFCTKVDYDSSITERILCFDCDTGSNNESGNCCDMQIG